MKVLKRELVSECHDGRFRIYRELKVIDTMITEVMHDPNPGSEESKAMKDIAEYIEGKSGEHFWMESAFNFEDHYIGEPDRARRLWFKYGIRPELADASDNVCSIGFSDRFQRWYGWSHRAIWGYKIGDVAEEGNFETTSGFIDGYLESLPEEERKRLDKRVPVGFTAHNLDDCKRMAIAMAESVS